MSLRAEVQLVREALEAALAPPLATAVLFEALDRWGRVPADSSEVLDLVRGPLGAILAERLGSQAQGELMALLEQRLASAEVELEVEIDLEEETEDSRTTQMAAVPHPVSVLVVSAEEGFGQRLLTSIGEDRVYPLTVGDEQTLRHTAFSATPLIAVVDASAPPAIRAPSLAAALRGLPNRVLPVVWGEETPYGRELRVRLEQHEHRALFLDRSEGIEPLLDLVLSRFRQSSIPPPG